jgi:hypothetical protein
MFGNRILKSGTIDMAGGGLGHDTTNITWGADALWWDLAALMRRMSFALSGVSSSSGIPLGSGASSVVATSCMLARRKS